MSALNSVTAVCLSSVASAKDDDRRLSSSGRRPPGQRLSSVLRARSSAFTLLELLVVIGLIAAMSFLLIGGLAGGGKSAALQAGQSTVANFVTVARTRAVATGNTTRILVRTSFTAENFRRLLLLVEQRNNTWETIDSINLPAGVFVLPYRTRVPPGMYPNAADWRTANGQEVLGSSALSATPVPYAFESGSTETWDYLGFTPRGTTETSQGSLVLATGRPTPPGELSQSDSPVVLMDPASVRGLQISTYGVPRLLNDRSGF